MYLMKYLFLLIAIFLPFQTFAQLSSSFSSITERAVIELSPEFPEPNQTVTAKVRSSSYESLDSANIVWHINDVERKRGIGETTFQFTAPEPGRNMELFVTVEKNEQDTFANFINIQTAELDLIYEANTYTPPFYKGRSIFTPQSTITFSALAKVYENGALLPKNRVTYNWYVNDNFVSDLSGTGKDSMIFQGDILSRPFSVSVSVGSANSNTKSRKKVVINAIQPKVVLYENNPIYGNMLEKALTGTFNFDREKVSLTAIPYFFSTNNRNSSQLTYKWYENGQRIGNETFGSFINYLNPNLAKSGVSNISVEVDHGNSFLQSGKSFFQVNVLGQQQSGTINTNEKPSAF